MVSLGSRRWRDASAEEANQDYNQNTTKNSSNRNNIHPRQSNNNGRRINKSRIASLFERSCVTGWQCGANNDNNLEASLRTLIATSPPSTFSPKVGCSNESDDSDSMQAYFAPSDFVAEHWKQQVRDHLQPETVSCAVIALATAVSHPLAFVLALGTWGTARAAGAGYNYYNHHYQNEISDAVPGSITTSSNKDGNLKHSASWMCWNMSAAPEEPQQTAFCFNLPGPLDSLNAAPSDSIDELQMSVATEEPQQTAYYLSVPVPEPLDSLNAASVDSMDELKVLSRTISATSPSPRNRRHHYHRHDANLGDESFLRLWVQEHYPPLTTSLISDERFVGLNALEFFNVFYADNAPYNFLECQKERGDANICYGSWQPVSLADNNIRMDSCQERVITFRSKTNTFLGPPYASTTKTQRYLLIDKKFAILESKTTFMDIPYYDRFHVHERWIITAARDDKATDASVEPASYNPASPSSLLHHASSCYTCHVTAFCEIVFNKSCPFETVIKKQASATLLEVTQAWCTMAQQALVLAEQTKIRRLLYEEQIHHISSTTYLEEIEVDYETFQRVESDHLPGKSQTAYLEEIEVDYETFQRAGLDHSARQSQKAYLEEIEVDYETIQRAESDNSPRKSQTVYLKDVVVDYETIQRAESDPSPRKIRIAYLDEIEVDYEPIQRAESDPSPRKSRNPSCSKWSFYNK
jgi:hypothetical protein